MNCKEIAKGNLCLWIQKHPKCATLFFIAITSIAIGLICGSTCGIIEGFIGGGSTALGLTLITMIATCKNKLKTEDVHASVQTKIHKKITGNQSSSRLVSTTSSSPTATSSDEAFTWDDWTVRLDQNLYHIYWYNNQTSEILWQPPKDSPWITIKEDQDGVPFYWNDWTKEYISENGHAYYFNHQTQESTQIPPPNSPWSTAYLAHPLENLPQNFLIKWNHWTKKYSSKDAKVYYYNEQTKKSVTDPPLGSPWARAETATAT